MYAAGALPGGSLAAAIARGHLTRGTDKFELVLVSLLLNSESRVKKSALKECVSTIEERVEKVCLDHRRACRKSASRVKKSVPKHVEKVCLKYRRAC